MSTTVHVKNISPKTSEQEVRDFFSFCGKISNLSVTPTADAPTAPKSATVTFEKETAAKTALLLDNTRLGDNTVEVSGAASIDDIAGDKAASQSHDDDHIQQEDKPRSRIVAEYLAHGYAISDKVIERALAMDQQHGVSNRFTSALKSFDDKYKATDKAKSADAKYGVSDKAANAWSGLYSYFDKAINTPTGQKLRVFYEQGNKQVMDVHNEARHLADLKSGKSTSSSSHEASAEEKEKMNLHHVPGTDNKTACDCSGSTGVCVCAEGQCACNGCGKKST